jgi:DNA-binding LytR/AlgR family response regulator
MGKLRQDMFIQFSGQLDGIMQEISTCKHMLETLVKNAALKPVYGIRMLVKSNGHMIIVRTEEIDWIEAWGDYIRLHCKEKSHIIRQKIGAVETQLNPQQFLRIGKSAIINVDRIHDIESLHHGDYLITLYDKTQLNLSRNYNKCLSIMFSQSP